MRKFGAAFYHGTKAQFRTLVDANGGFEAAAMVTRVNKTALHAYCDLKAPQFPPADVISDLEAACGEPIVTRWQARAQGYQLVPIEPGDSTRVSEINPLAMCAEATEGLGEFGREALKIVADGKVDNLELDELEQRCAAQVRYWERQHDDVCRVRVARRQRAA